MSDIVIVRTDKELPDEKTRAVVRDFLFGVIDGIKQADAQAWRRFVKHIVGMGSGEMCRISVVFPRHRAFHRRHMLIESRVFDAQERFKDFEQFRNWLKIGAGFVDWVPGAKGGIVPLPRSISYAKTDQEEFELYHKNMIDFLYGEHCAPYLWRHLDDPYEMIRVILEEFNEVRPIRLSKVMQERLL
jgi:hypothetical protein